MIINPNGHKLIFTVVDFKYFNSCCFHHFILGALGNMLLHSHEVEHKIVSEKVVQR